MSAALKFPASPSLREIAAQLQKRFAFKAKVAAKRKPRTKPSTGRAQQAPASLAGRSPVSLSSSRRGVQSRSVLLHPISPTPGLSSADGAQAENATLQGGSPVSISSLCAEVTVQQRNRLDFMRAVTAVTLQVHSICKRHARAKLGLGDDLDRIKEEGIALYDAVCYLFTMSKVKDKRKRTVYDHPLAAETFTYVLPLLEARAGSDAAKERYEDAMVEAFEKLPIAKWVAATRGIGICSIAQVIGEAGDLSGYSNPSKLWKRMGLAVIDGIAQRKCSDREQAIQHGFNPYRRSVMHVVGESFMKATGGPYKTVYDERKVYLVAREEGKGLKVVPAAKLPKDKAKRAGFVAEGTIHKNAMRYAEKRLLRDLWCEWNGKPILNEGT